MTAAENRYKVGFESRKGFRVTRILILEDDKVFARLVAGSLEAEGFDVVITHSGAEALEMVVNERIDLALVDLFIKVDGMLTPDGGVLFISRLRAQIPGRSFATPRDVPVLAMTGMAGELWNLDVLNMAVKLGANDILAKPFPPASLFRRIHELLGQSAAA